MRLATHEAAEAADLAERPDTIDLRPSDEGYASVGALFVEQIMKDIRKPRAADDRDLMIEVIRIAAWLGKQGRGDLLARMTPR